MAEPLKNAFNVAMIGRIARSLTSAERTFKAKRFVSAATRDFDGLELMDRARQVAAALHVYLPRDYGAATRVILASLAYDSRPARSGPMDAFRFLPFLNFIAEHGLDHFEESMRAQYELTKRFTAEFSIRAYLKQHPDRTLVRLREWAGDPDPHVRRLVSEGTRPRLPWASRLRSFQEDPAPVLALLERLRDDPSDYVRRSVANNLNDIGKDHPEILIATATRWMKGASPDRAALVRHALRFLVKRGHLGALRVLGYGDRARVLVTGSAAPARVAVGGRTRVTVTVKSTAPGTQRLAVDLAVHYVKSDGSRRLKVFKLDELDLGPREERTLSKVLSFAQHTTRRHHPGRHPLDVIVNGAPHGIRPIRVVGAS